MCSVLNILLHYITSLLYLHGFTTVTAINHPKAYKFYVTLSHFFIFVVIFNLE